MKVLVTGATGFIGANLVRLLLRQGCDVRVLVRPSSLLNNLKNLEVEIAHGDLRDKASLKKACRGVSQLYHVAAAYDFWLPNTKEFYDINVGGTQNILEAALEEKVEKVVYTSTVGVLRYPDDPAFPSDETAVVSPEDLHNDYKRSKFEAEVVAMEFAKNGLPVVIVNPSAPIGAYDVKPTPTGKMVVDFLKGHAPAYVNTGLNVVDVEDVAMGHWLAARRGRVGERYILGNKNMSLKEIYECIARLSGKTPPRFQIPYAVALAAACASELVGKILRRRPAIPVGAVRMAKKFMYFTPAKAVKELGLPQSPVENAFEKAIKFFSTPPV